VFELTFTLLWQGCTMTDSVPQHNFHPPRIALHLLCDAVDPFTNHPQLYTSAACQHLPGALTRPACNEKLSLLASTQQVHRPLGQLLGNATDLVVRESQTNTEVPRKEGLAIVMQCRQENWPKEWSIQPFKEGIAFILNLTHQYQLCVNEDIAEMQLVAELNAATIVRLQRQTTVELCELLA